MVLQRLASIYGHTWDETYLEMARDLADHLIDPENPDALTDKMSGGALYKWTRNAHALREYDRVTGDSRAREALLKLLDYNYRFPMISSPFASTNHAALLYTLGYEWTGRREYLRVVNQLVQDSLAVERTPGGPHTCAHPTMGVPAALTILGKAGEPIAPYPLLELRQDADPTPIVFEKMTGREARLGVFVRLRKDEDENAQADVQLRASDGQVIDTVKVRRQRAFRSISPVSGKRERDRYLEITIPAGVEPDRYSLTLPNAAWIRMIDADGSINAAQSAPQPAIPVTSYRVDVGDDPENGYGGAPVFDWGFFGGRMRTWTRFPHALLAYRQVADVPVYTMRIRDFTVPNKFAYLESALTGMAGPKSNLSDKPAIPLVIYAYLGKGIYGADGNERARGHSRTDIDAYLKHYPNTIFAGGATSEEDAMIRWCYQQFYARYPVGPYGSCFPFTYLDLMEANARRGGAPFMFVSHNAQWTPHYSASTRLLSLAETQLFYRGANDLTLKLAKTRSAFRQYAVPWGVQFSGQIRLAPSNVDEALSMGVEPVWHLPRIDSYQKSYALSRQILYLSWLNGARHFAYETGVTYRHHGVNYLITPLGQFMAKADRRIGEVGPTGPLQTPIALLSEFSRAWQKPEVTHFGRIFFKCFDEPYTLGDFQKHAISDFFFPRYLQSERFYSHSGSEENAIAPTPYGHSVDFLLSDVRAEALDRYGLVVWAGVPPRTPKLVRHKLEEYLKAGKGRVVLFAEAAKALYPEWFEGSGSPKEIREGAIVDYAGQVVREEHAFQLERPKVSPAAASMTVLARVGDEPLILERVDGLLVALSSCGLNDRPLVNVGEATWARGDETLNMPHVLLEHARRLLDAEARKQRLFDVGNPKLHYVVTRPKAGEYLIGMANDQLAAEPFEIHSHIGKVIKIEEIALKDGKDALKSVVNGAAYAPTNLRDSPALPLDYGRSDTSHIEGRDFRLFRINVVESGVRVVDRIRFRDRPTERVLSVPSLAYIRHYLQGLPSFYQWFDGVKIPGPSLTELDPRWLKHIAYTIDRRGLRVVVDARGGDRSDLAKLVDKLGILKRAPKDLIVDRVEPGDQETGAEHEVRLLSAAQVCFLRAPGDRLRGNAKLTCLDLYYRDEDALFSDYRHFFGASVSESLQGAKNPNCLFPRLRPDEVPSGDFLYAGIHIPDLKGMIHSQAEAYRKLKGLKIDSTYLLSKTKAALRKDGRVLREHGLEVVVDLSRDQYFNEGITFYSYRPCYVMGLAWFDQVIEKMPAIGARGLILTVKTMFKDFENEKHYRDRDQTLNRFTRRAKARGISLHLIGIQRLRNKPVILSDRADCLKADHVFVIDGFGRGKPSPFALLRADREAVGSGSVRIHDHDRGQYILSPYDDWSWND